MSHDLNFSADTGETISWYLKVNGCAKALVNMFSDDEVFWNFYNRNLVYSITKDELIKLISDVKNLDWKGRVIPDWIIVQLNGLTKLAETFDFTEHNLYVETL